jgi:hypothetical protein
MLELIRRNFIGVVKTLESLGLERATRDLAIPDFHDRAKAAVTVIKSVGALGWVEAITKGIGSSLRPILLIRHPCAVVASMLRGAELGVMAPPGGLGQLLDTLSARDLGIDSRTFRPSDEVESIAWNWLLANAEAYQAVKTSGGSIVIYEKLVSGGADAAVRLFSQPG